MVNGPERATSDCSCYLSVNDKPRHRGAEFATVVRETLAVRRHNRTPPAAGGKRGELAALRRIGGLRSV